MSQSKQKKITSRFKSMLDDLKRDYPKHQHQFNNPIILVSISEQVLYLIENPEVISSYPISSAEKGVGNISGSFQTPLGLHQISDKFGENAAVSSIFKARQNTNQIATIIENPETRSSNDNITSRILWLEGLEEGINKGVNDSGVSVDSYSRYIYIHGTDEEGLIGKPASHGCIRMSNHDVIDLFDAVENGCVVFISEDAIEGKNIR